MVKFSTRSRYGLRAMVYLAENAQPMAGEKVAKHEGVSKKYLDAILNQLRESRLVKSIRGPGGGYVLSRAPESISVGDVVEALEGGLLIVPCLEENYGCRKIKTCGSRKVWAAVSSAIEETLGRITLADVVEGRVSEDFTQDMRAGGTMLIEPGENDN